MLASNEIKNVSEFSVSISEAFDRIKNICITYLEKNEDGTYVIPVNRQRPVMLIGPAGIGKTDVPRQVAEKLDIGFVSYSITHHTRQSALGLPKIVTRTYENEEVLTTEYTASEIITAVRDEIERTGNKNGILFIDEVNCASETLAAPLLQLFQNKTLGQSRIPEGWILVMAGNPPEYNKSVKDFDAVTRDRLRIINVEPDSKAWLEYADKHDINPAITAFIAADETMIHSFDEENNGILTPRGWEELSMTINSYEKHKFPITSDLIAQYIGTPLIAKEFYNYYRLVKETITEEEIDLIVSGKATKEIVSKLKGCKMNVRFMLISCMKKRLHKAALENDLSVCNEMMNNIYDFVRKLYGKGGELEVFMSGILSDKAIVKAACILKNDVFTDYLEEISNTEGSIKKQMKKMSLASKTKGDEG